MAGEVRNLAQRSSTSAKDIERIIRESVHTNRTGSELVQRNGQIMERIAGSIREVSSVLEGISRDLDMQKQEIEQIHCSIDEVEQTTSENEGQVERTAAICGDILEAAQGMRRLLDDMTHLGRRSQSDR